MMSWLGVKWFYGPKDERQGPFSQKEIRNLIETGVITSETRLCESREKSDYPAIKTEFSVYFPREDFIAATKDDHAPVFWMWLAVFAPLLFTGFSYFIYFTGRVPMSSSMPLAVFSASFMFIDSVFIARKGYKMLIRPITYSIFSALIFFCPMIYFYYRNKQLRRNQISTFASVACLLLIICMNVTWPFLKNKDVEEYSVRLFNVMLQPLLPEITAECASASVQRLPGMKFEVIGHLSDGQEMKMTLAQSWRSLNAYSKDGERVDISMPSYISGLFLKKQGLELTPAEQSMFGIDALNRQDYHTAVEWFSEAAEQGYAPAQFLLGTMYFNGQGVEQDRARAFEWSSKAAEQGHAQAQHFLGVMYEYGHGIEKDDKKAVEWYSKAAEQGNNKAQRALGFMFENGRGVEKDNDKALEWYRRAVAHGNSRAEEDVERLNRMGIR